MGASVLVGVLAIAPGLWLASALADGRGDVQSMITVEVWSLPLTLPGAIVTSIAMGQEAWRQIGRQQLFSVLVPVPVFAVLAVRGQLTVVSAALTLIGAAMLGYIPMIGIARACWRPAIGGRLWSEAWRYGIRATPITLSQIMNHRLDQVIMAPLVSSHQLGLYAVAVTVAGLTSTLAGAMSTVSLPRFAQESSITDPGRIVRTGIVAVAAMAVALALISPIAVPLLFGSEFARAYPMILVLLLAALPLAGVGLFAALYAARNKIGLAGLSEIAALAITLVGLLIALRPLGAMERPS